MCLYLGELIIGRIFASEIWGAYFREGLFYLFIYLFIYLFFYLFIFFFWGGGGGGLLSEFYGSLWQVHGQENVLASYWWQEKQNK